MPDSARWCATCRKYGDHHTDRHLSGGASASQRKAAQVYDALVAMQARPATTDDDATVLIEAASFVAAVRDGRFGPAEASS